ncbi:tRNA dimethylallyltransferase [Spirochaetia bacterium]|nr:tRNA dimethylallyltransferase [Spirochaetia bacterium]
MPEPQSSGQQTEGLKAAGPIPVLLLFGPTASGKTDILEALFSGDASLCPAEIISADSMQVYRGMDIGTAKPSAALRARLPHHLIDIRSPKEQFNAGEFVRLAGEAAVDIANRGKLPVISGGTGFYLTNFVQGLPATPPADFALRQTLQDELHLRGVDALRVELEARDPVSARRIHPHDEYRLLRALEVCRLTGRPLSSYPRNSASVGKADESANTRTDGAPNCSRNLFRRNSFRFLLIGLDRPREEVYRRIDARCAQMFREGLPAEVRRLYESGCTPADPGMKAIGYREFFIQTETGETRLNSDLAAVEAQAAQNSRHYAKRQITYFATLPDVHWIDAACDGPSRRDDPAGQIREMVEGFIKEGGS